MTVCPFVRSIPGLLHRQDIRLAFVYSHLAGNALTASSEHDGPPDAQITRPSDHSFRLPSSLQASSPSVSGASLAIRPFSSRRLAPARPRQPRIHRPSPQPQGREQSDPFAAEDPFLSGKHRLKLHFLQHPAAYGGAARG